MPKTDKAYDVLDADTKKRIEDSFAPAEPPPRTKESLLSEAYSNVIAAERAEAEGNEEEAKRQRENEAVNLAAAKKAKS